MRVRPTDSRLVRSIGGAAIVLAAAGTVLAVPPVHAAVANHINGANIAKHSITGDRLKSNTITGSQVKESTLGRVRSAANAAKLGGVPASGFLRSSRYFTFYATMTDQQPTETVGKFGPLVFRGSCDFNGESGNAFATLVVGSTKTLYLAASGSQGFMSALAPDTPKTLIANEDPDAPSSEESLLDAYVADGSFALAPASTVVAVNGVGPSEADCTFYGQLVNVGR